MAGIDEDRLTTLTDHLTELRERLIKSAYAIFFGAIICWFFRDQIFEWIADPILPHIPGGKLKFFNPTDAFMTYMKLAITGGVILSCPVWLYQIWRFVAPGLYQKEKRYTAVFILAGTVLFLVGGAFAYFLVLPTGLKFLLNFSKSAEAFISINEYLSFFTTMVLVFGAAFELPLILVILGIIGLIDAKFLRSKRRYAIVILSIASAILTPPDIMSMLMLFVPLLALYEISILLVATIGKKRIENAN